MLSKLSNRTTFLFKKQKFKYSNVPEPLSDIGKYVFNESVLRNSIKPETFEAFLSAKNSGKSLEKAQKNEIASAMQKWAMERGCVTFSHWFSPMRGCNGEKHDSFIDLNFKNGDIVVDFSGTKLFTGETDGSSFPNGGMRATHAAAAYTAWDISSPPFIRDDVLFIPSGFIAWTGQSLDVKTPLLKANETLSEQGVRLLRNLGDNETTSVVSNVGWEQEFFVIDRENYHKRPDLVHTGRTLIGASPSLGQQSEKHYFGKMPLRVRDYLRDVQKELWSLGISFNTLHNEVAPAQHEISPVFSLTNVASDQNVLAMEVLESVALRHGLVCLLHEKPFANLNGSGKHNNWGLNTNTGENLFVPGKTKEQQQRFIVFVTALARALDVHGDILRVGVATSGNDHRLGAQEAPPAIISLYTGTLMEKHLNRILKDNGPLEGYGVKTETLNFGTNSILEIEKNIEDRNRTAPFPFCGNRFEFRAVGSTQNIAWPLTLVNAAMTDSMSAMSDLLESGKSPKDAVKEMLSKHIRVVFNGNGYSKEWAIEAQKRGLWYLPQTVDALGAFDSPKNVELFEKTRIFTKEELTARSDILYENYTKAILCEIDCFLNMVTSGVLAGCAKELYQLSSSSSLTMKQMLADKDALYSLLYQENKKLKDMYDAFPSDGDHATQAKYASQDLKKQMEHVRSICDKVEKVLPKDLYPFPKYDEIIYDHHSESD